MDTCTPWMHALAALKVRVTVECDQPTRDRIAAGMRRSVDAIGGSSETADRCRDMLREVADYVEREQPRVTAK